MEGVKLDGAILCHTLMPDGKRVYSNCKNANLTWVNLTGVDLESVKLDGAILCHTLMPDKKEGLLKL